MGDRRIDWLRNTVKEALDVQDVHWDEMLSSKVICHKVRVCVLLSSVTLPCNAFRKIILASLAKSFLVS